MKDIPRGARPRSFGVTQHPKNSLVEQRKQMLRHADRERAFGYEACASLDEAEAQALTEKLQRP